MYRTLDDWNKRGYRVNVFTTSRKRNKKNVPLFFDEQVHHNSTQVAVVYCELPGPSQYERR